MLQSIGFILLETNTKFPLLRPNFRFQIGSRKYNIDIFMCLLKNAETFSISET